LGLRPWTPLGDFNPPGYFPLCVNHPPKVTEPLTPLGGVPSQPSLKPPSYQTVMCTQDDSYVCICMSRHVGKKFASKFQPIAERTA